MLTSLFAMAGFALAGAITPGPVNVIAMRHGSQSRRICAIFYVLGASISYALVVWIMGLSGQWLLQDPAVAIAASWVCAAYLAWLAWRIAPRLLRQPERPHLGFGLAVLALALVEAGFWWDTLRGGHALLKNAGVLRVGFCEIV